MATTTFRHDGPRRNERPDHDVGPTIRVDNVRFSDRPDPQLFADIAGQLAEEVARGSGDRVNKSTQLRRFYDELVMWQAKVGTSEERFVDAQPYIYMLKAKVAYSRGREHVDANFEALFRRVIDQAVSATTLRQAKLFMEAFMAFYKVHRPK
jgi:CRISPR-associated protein Csm2